ncbi:membrane-bound lytic murein transglycosylase F [Microbulbifer donghaiensis]|uniref:Membrane-bound lytic murein transglycosylase F n=1 Tax=Microbulbifer donghaiensis TaxID=494016 RepID=A0A1M5D214_9GAMM|nr:transporter substrate-binding domain-containing protein [Microbulbifer donghaiensis]SHF60930.1 membrane-bound lytic murein transglycosylase F [Microbulbifer donghaiensis]
MGTLLCRVVHCTLLTLLCLAALACERAARDTTETTESAKTAKKDSDTLGWAPQIQGEYPIELFDNYTETGDLERIQKRGRLRLLVDPGRSSMLKRAATQQDVEIAQARLMAQKLGLELTVLQVAQFADLIPQLNAGKGDLIANNLIVTEGRREQVEFSAPSAEIQLMLVSGKATPAVGDSDNLAGKTLTVTAGTKFVERAQAFARQHPGLQLDISDQNYMDILVDVANGKTDFTIVDELLLELTQQFRDDLKANRIFPEKYELAWAIRQNSPQLLGAVDDAVRHIRLTRPSRRSTGDLDAIQQRGVLRAVTRNHPGTYFMWKGQILGFEFSLLEKYANKLGVRLEIIVAERHDDFVRALQNGDADIAASLLSDTERRRQKGMAFSSSYIDTPTGIIARRDDTIASVGELAGRTVYVRKSGSHYDTALRLQKTVPQLQIELAPEELDIQQIIDRVGEGKYDLTIADEVSYKIERAWRDDIAFPLELPDEKSSYSWMLRDSNPQLLESINGFFAKRKVGDVLPTLYTRYFDRPKRTREEITQLSKKGNISPFDDLVRNYAEQFGFDWRLVVAQMFQESGFDPKAKSWVGAQGLMQVMPDTGKQVGESDLFDPRTSIRAGIKYLDWLHGKFVNRGLNPENSMWFTLAAYNAGLGHVFDAQDLAEQKGWDRDTWFDNVEKAMLLLAEPIYYKRARYGYARGQEPFDYVRKIENRFRHFVSLLDAHDRQQQVTRRAPGASIFPERDLLSPLFSYRIQSHAKTLSAGSEAAASWRRLD